MSPTDTYLKTPPTTNCLIRSELGHNNLEYANRFLMPIGTKVEGEGEILTRRGRLVARWCRPLQNISVGQIMKTDLQKNGNDKLSTLL